MVYNTQNYWGFGRWIKSETPVIDGLHNKYGVLEDISQTRREFHSLGSLRCWWKVGWFGLFLLLPLGAQGIRETLRFTSVS
jgi:hypothetical protein